MFRFAAGAACAVVVLSCCDARGELLTNGDLELPADGGDGSSADLATGWTLEETPGTSTADFRSFGNHTPGGERGLWFRSFEGGLGGDAPFTVDATLYQDVPGSPGATYELSAWFQYEPNYSGLDPAVGTQTLLSLEFLDAGDMVLGSSVLDIDTVQVGDSVWRQYSVLGVAPLGTVTVRSSAAMINGVLADENPQSAFVDDFSLIPAPGSAMALALTGVLGLRRRR